GKPALALVEIVPLALREPPDARPALAERTVTVSPSMATMTFMSRRRTLDSGSTTCAPLVEAMPRMTGAWRLPDTVPLTSTVPDSCVPRSARKRLASDSGADPLRLRARALPASGTVPLAVIDRPCGPFTEADDRV